MEFEKKEKYSLIVATEHSFKEFFNSFEKNLDVFAEHHIILDLSSLTAFKKEDFLLFLDIIKLKEKNGTSFVVVNKMAKADDYPENFNIVPTLIEAEDIIEMEAIERELGF